MQVMMQYCYTRVRKVDDREIEIIPFVIKFHLHLLSVRYLRTKADMEDCGALFKVHWDVLNEYVDEIDYCLINKTLLVSSKWN
jgi:hypothetical protein